MARPNISLENLRDMEVPAPPIDEQDRIADELKRNSGKAALLRCAIQQGARRSNYFLLRFSARLFDGAYEPMKTQRGNGKRHATQQSVNSAVKSICDIMRRSNCAGALQYVPELTWILFLRILDEREEREAQEADAVGQDYPASLEAPYRWRDWAAPAAPQREQLQQGALGTSSASSTASCCPTCAT